MVACRPQFAPKILYSYLGLANSLYIEYLIIKIRTYVQMGNRRCKKEAWCVCVCVAWPFRGGETEAWFRRNV